MSHLVLTGATALAAALVIFRKVEFKPQYDFALIAYAFFVFLYVISFFGPLRPLYGLNELLLFVNAGILLFLISGSEISEKILRYFAVVLIVAATGETLAGFFIYTQKVFPRFGSTFLYANDYANFLLLILPVTAWQFFRRHARKSTAILSGLALSILLSGFLLSFSRAAWISALGAIFIFVIWFFLYKKSAEAPISAAALKQYALRAAAAAILTAILVAGLQFARSQKFETTPLLLKAGFQADEGSASVTERIEFWRAAIDMIRDADSSGLGSGILSFRFIYPEYYQTKFGTNWDHPHNIFLKIGVENGGITALVFLVFIIGAITVISKFLFINPRHPVFFFGLGAAASLAHNLVDFNFGVANFMLFIVFIGIGFSFERRMEILPRAANSAPKIIFAILSIILLALGVYEGYFNAYFKLGRRALAEGSIEKAINYLERSESLIFRRDLPLYLSAAYKRQYKLTADKKWRDKEYDILAEFAVYPDARVPFRTGEILEEKGLLKDAAKSYRLALELDPKNNFKYYYHVIASIAKQPGAAPRRKEILALLEEYKSILRNNRHNTILTDNPYFAYKLYDFFGMPVDRDEIKFLYSREVAKYNVKYGALPFNPFNETPDSH